jgi:hypothetical protein
MVGAFLGSSLPSISAVADDASILPDAEASYRRAVQDGVDEFEAGHWVEARAAFRRAHALRPSARTFRGIGLSAFAAGDYVEAVDSLVHALSDVRSPLTEDQRVEVDHTLERARGRTGRFRVELDPADALLQIDASPVLLDEVGILVLPLGQHVMIASRPGYTRAQQLLVVRGGEEGSVRLTLVPQATVPVAPFERPRSRERDAGLVSQPASRPPWPATRTWGWITLGAAPALALAAGVVWWTGASKADQVVSECRQQGGCTRGELGQKQSDASLSAHQTWTTVALATAVASAAAGVVLLSVSAHAGTSAPGGPRPTATILAGPGPSGTIQLTF